MQSRRRPDPSAGQHVFLADGEDIGVIDEIVAPPSRDTDAILVVRVDSRLFPADADHLFIPQQAVHSVTETDVIIGTTAPWVAAHHWTAPPAVD